MRRAISLTEVLISLGLLTLGLLGVASIFPTGSWYLMRADDADRGAAVAQSVMNDLVIRGLVNPKAWYVYVPGAHGQSQAHNIFDKIDNRYIPQPNPSNPTFAVRRSTFTRPFSDALAASTTQLDPVIVSRQMGNAYIIDPAYCAAAAERTAMNNNNAIAYGFPANATLAYPKAGAWPYYLGAAWDTWRSTTNAPERVWPIRRVTFQDADGLPLRLDAAKELARVADDLVYDLPSRDDRASRQDWNIDGNGNPINRQASGDFSWIASVVPSDQDARDGMASNPGGCFYDVSVVVFKKRILPSQNVGELANANPSMNPGDAQAQMVTTDRAVGAAVVSTGLNGGELLLTEIKDGVEQTLDSNGLPILNGKVFESLKRGQYMMLCGPHPNTTPNAPRFVLQWYQVLTIEETGDRSKRLVSVRGPQWPWLPETGNADLSNNLCAGVCRGAIAVHTRTMKLEGIGDGLTLRPTTP